MPVRSLDSSVLRWPDADVVDRAARAWAASVGQDPNVKRVGYFGSYARGDWGVGSDLDVIVIVAATDEPFERRALRFRTDTLPVPADVLVYTETEWERLLTDSAFHRQIRRQAVWAYPTDDESSSNPGSPGVLKG